METYEGESSVRAVFLEGPGHRWRNVEWEVNVKREGSCRDPVGSVRNGMRESERALRRDEDGIAAYRG